MSRADVPVLHAVTDDRVLARGSAFVESAREVLRVGGRDLALHLRGPGTGGARLYELARSLRSDARASGARLLINDRVDVALASGADGIHLGRRSLPSSIVRRLVGSEVLLGESTHSVEEAEEARNEGADYLFLGTIFPSASHPDRSPVGTDLLRAVAKLGTIPVIAIGGMAPERIGTVVDAGAAGAATISALWDADRPAAAVRDFLRALGEGRIPTTDGDEELR